ncbi:hypothetical protein LSPH24S_06152 [Lysinibacillus sphaericus]
MTATVLIPFNQSILSSETSAIRYEGVPAISTDTCVRRFELLDFGSPTTISKSASLLVSQLLLDVLVSLNKFLYELRYVGTFLLNYPLNV